MARKPQPLDRIEWVPRDAITENDYNPNKAAPPESRLLKVSLLEDGWTQPLVVFDDGTGRRPIIIDGAHRHRLSADPEVFALTDGMVPIVRVTGDVAHRMMSTIRHNRARGEHFVLPMAEIVRKLLEAGEPAGRIMKLLGMESEEVERLAERAGMPEKVGRTATGFSVGWVPDK